MQQAQQQDITALQTRAQGDMASLMARYGTSLIGSLAPKPGPAGMTSMPNLVTALGISR